MLLQAGMPCSAAATETRAEEELVRPSSSTESPVTSQPGPFIAGGKRSHAGTVNTQTAAQQQPSEDKEPSHNKGGELDCSLVALSFKAAEKNRGVWGVPSALSHP